MTESNYNLIPGFCPGFAARSWLSILLLAGLGMSPVCAEPLEIFRDCETCPEMIELPLGEFVMGAPRVEFRGTFWVYYDVREDKLVTATEFPSMVESEGPQHRVVIDLPIAMGKNEVTFDEWMACVEDGGCNGYVPRRKITAQGHREAIERALADPRFAHTPSERAIARVTGNPSYLEIGGRYPVLYISYLDAKAYVSWLNGKLGTASYRLPTEAEWEYAARAGTTTPFWQGLEAKPGQANISGEATEWNLQAPRPDLRTLGHPVPVDELDAANAWGLRHMSGNAEEVTLSCYSDHYEGWATSSEWLEQSTQGECERAARGGSYSSSMYWARVASREGRDQDDRSWSSGFRIVKEMR